VEHARRDDSKAGALEARDDLADRVLLDCVGFDDRQGPLNRQS
jgi:hypothetical protein